METPGEKVLREYLERKEKLREDNKRVDELILEWRNSANKK